MLRLLLPLPAIIRQALMSPPITSMLLLLARPRFMLLNSPSAAQ
jgi:hypothetical protein